MSTTEPTPLATTPRLRFVQRSALALLVLSGAVNTIDRAALAIANPLVRRDLNLSVSEMGLLLSAFLWAYAFAQLPVGPLIDRLGPRRLLGAGLAIWSTAQLRCVLVGSVTQFAAARVLLGIGEAPQFPTGGRVVRDWFNARDRGRASGIFNSASTLGTGIAAPLLTTLMLLYGWRGMFAIMGLLGIGAAIVWYACYRDPAQVALTPEEDHHRTAGDAPESSRPVTFSEWRRLFRCRTTWGMVLGYFGVIYVNWLFNAWLPGYLEMGRHMSLRHTGWVAAIPYVFAVLGGVSGGFLIDWLMARGLSRIDSRKFPLCLTMLGEAGFVVVAALIASNTTAVACLCGAMFCGTIATTSAWAMVSIAAPANSTGSLGSLQNFGGYLGGALAPIVTGFIVQMTGSFVPALMVGAVMCVFAAVSYFVILRRPITPEDLLPSSHLLGVAGLEA